MKRLMTGGVCVAAMLVSVACEQDEPPPTAGDILPEGVDVAFTHLRTFMTREGVRRARVEADTAQEYEGGELHLRPLTLTFFDEFGRESTVVTADFGIYYEATEDMEAEGTVVAIDRVDDQRIETERMRYVNIDDRLYGDTAFTLYRDGGGTIIDGAAFESDPGLDSVIVLSPSGQTDRAGIRTSGGPAEAQSGPDSTRAAASDSLSAGADVQPAAPADSGVTVEAPPPDSGAVSPPDSSTVADTLSVRRAPTPGRR